MASYQVTCHSPDNLDADRRIQGLGGSLGWYDIDTIIRMIESGIHHFWTTAYGQRVDVIVRQHGLLGKKYLTTTADGFPPNNLLRLPFCQR
ncbi:MAG: DUF3892 domain-containing protein [Sphingomicrobium sp.]